MLRVQQHRLEDPHMKQRTLLVIKSMALHGLPFSSDIHVALPSSNVEFLVYSDAAVRCRSSFAARCRIQDSSSRWICDFSGRIGTCSVLMAELWALWQSMGQISFLKLNNVKLMTDCYEAFNLLLQRAKNAVAKPLCGESASG